jgi:hypothetical protein
LRVGAIPDLRIKDLEPVDKYQIYKVNVYATSKKSKYFTFCTPECRKEIDAYLEWRERLGERLKDTSPLFRKEFSSLMIQHPQVLNIPGIRFFVDKLLKDTGIRTIEPLTELNTDRRHRSHIMECHGMRKFFETNAFKAGMDNIYIRRLMGQSSGLEDSYLKLSEEELLEGDSKHVGYIGIIDQLTISEENRLKREVKTLRIEKSKMEQVLERINTLENKILNQQ